MRRKFATVLMLGMALCACNSSNAPCAGEGEATTAAASLGNKASSTNSSSEASETIESRLWRIQEAMNACIGKEPPTVGWLRCYDNARHAHDTLLPKTSTHEDLGRLFTLLGDPMEHTMAGGEALYARKMAGGSFADLTWARVIVLTGAQAPGPEIGVGHLDPGPRLGWLADRDLAAEAEALWTSIRDRDCKAYPVPRCADRLDAIFRELIDHIVVNEVRSRTEGWSS